MSHQLSEEESNKIIKAYVPPIALVIGKVVERIAVVSHDSYNRLLIQFNDNTHIEAYSECNGLDRSRIRLLEGIYHGSIDAMVTRGRCLIDVKK